MSGKYRQDQLISMAQTVLNARGGNLYQARLANNLISEVAIRTNQSRESVVAKISLLSMGVPVK